MAANLFVLESQMLVCGEFLFCQKCEENGRKPTETNSMYYVLLLEESSSSKSSSESFVCSIPPSS